MASLCYVGCGDRLLQLHADFLTIRALTRSRKSEPQGRRPRNWKRGGRRWREFKEMYSNPLINAAITLLEPLPVGGLISLVSAEGVADEGAETAPSLERREDQAIDVLPSTCLKTTIAFSMSSIRPSEMRA